MSGNGENPLRWNCEKDGCFNLKKRPKIEIFAKCLPRMIAFSDIDGIVELGGNFLILEWKAYVGVIPLGQDIMFKRMANTGCFSIFVICGDAETMIVSAIKVYHGQQIRNWEKIDLQGLMEKIKRWGAWAEKQKAHRAA